MYLPLKLTQGQWASLVRGWKKLCCSCASFRCKLVKFFRLSPTKSANGVTRLFGLHFIGIFSDYLLCHQKYREWGPWISRFIVLIEIPITIKDVNYFPATKDNLKRNRFLRNSFVETSNVKLGLNFRRIVVRDVYTNVKERTDSLQREIAR